MTINKINYDCFLNLKMFLQYEKTLTVQHEAKLIKISVK